ncbi:MAG: hypothetical protein OEZ13_08550, partial [Spirochaetia bacterium]|nr:hypothetical protein [Spirochaetia bacterium]
MPTKQKKSNNADNPKKGILFENEAKEYFKNKLNLSLERGLSLKISANGKEKGEHKFDLGSKQEKIIIECKSHKWTAGYNAPSAKMSVWNEAMYYFHLA